MIFLSTEDEFNLNERATTSDCTLDCIASKPPYWYNIHLLEYPPKTDTYRALRYVGFPR